MENSTNKYNDQVSQELINEANKKYNEILNTYTIQELLRDVEYEVIESERPNVLNMTIEEYLRDWSRSGLY